MKCNQCDFDNRPEARFCENCGTPLTVAPPKKRGRGLLWTFLSSLFLLVLCCGLMWAGLVEVPDVAALGLPDWFENGLNFVRNWQDKEGQTPAAAPESPPPAPPEPAPAKAYDCPNISGAEPVSYEELLDTNLTIENVTYPATEIRVSFRLPAGTRLGDPAGSPVFATGEFEPRDIPDQQALQRGASTCEWDSATQILTCEYFRFPNDSIYAVEYWFFEDGQTVHSCKPFMEGLLADLPVEEEPVVEEIIAAPTIDRCGLFSSMDMKVVYMDWMPGAPLQFYFKMPGGVPGLEKDVPNDGDSWEYTATIGDYNSPKCKFLAGYEERLYCSIALPSGYSNSSRPLSLSVNGCDSPIFHTQTASVPGMERVPGSGGSSSSSSGDESGGSSSGCGPQPDICASFSAWCAWQTCTYPNNPLGCSSVEYSCP